MKKKFTFKSIAGSITHVGGFTFVVLFLSASLIAVFFIDGAAIRNFFSSTIHKENQSATIALKNDFWTPPDTNLIEKEKDATLIKYGRQLIANTSYFFGPSGISNSTSNGMNCQNCHLDAGTKIFGNNYSAVASTYPKFRGRSGSIETIEKRVNDCFERSLNGIALDENSSEMKAIVSYIKWVGQNVSKGESPKGSGLMNISFIDRPADPEKGRIFYKQKCTVCHGENGQGIKNESGKAYAFPPLWGDNSYNTGAGLFRLSRFAGYIKANMPLGATHLTPQLSDEECWDIAAYVNSLPRPQKDLSDDWPDISKKPFDHPFGPFTDKFSEAQHKFGPFKPMIKTK